MQYSIATVFGFAAFAMAVPQAVTENLSPDAPSPPGCSKSYPNSFYISTVNASSGASKMMKRQSPNLSITLEDGILKDQDGNVGYIASNKQFQFADGATPNAQAGSIYTAGFSICGNNSLALGGTTIFESCNSGSFDNLYYGNTAEQCDNVYINAIDTGKSAGGAGGLSSSMSASSMSASYSASATAAVGGLPDNQPTAPVAAGPTPTPVTPSASFPPTGAPAPTQYTGGAAIATAAPMAMAAAGAFLAML